MRRRRRDAVAAPRWPAVRPRYSAHNDTPVDFRTSSACASRAARNRSRRRRRARPIPVELHIAERKVTDLSGVQRNGLRHGQRCRLRRSQDAGLRGRLSVALDQARDRQGCNRRPRSGRSPSSRAPDRRNGWQPARPFSFVSPLQRSVLADRPRHAEIRRTRTTSARASSRRKSSAGLGTGDASGRPPVRT